MPKYLGQCHCGRIRFSIETVLDKAVRCNCSICLRKGMLYHRVAPENLEHLTPLEDASLYQFGSMIAKHYFCPVCGIHTFNRPRAAPHLYSVNVNCLEIPDDLRANIVIVDFDGRDGWDAGALNAQLGRD
jgi:hypothetical protein